MAYPTGAVQLSSFIGTTGPLDPYATHLDYMGLGGHRAVATIAERDAIIVQRRSFGMLVTVNNDPNPANNKTYQLCNVAMGGTNDSLTPLNTSNLNWREFSTGSSFNFTGGPKSLYSDPTTNQITDYQYTTTRLLDSFQGADFDEKLRYACQNADNGTVIDCTAYQGTTQTLSQTVVITKSIMLLFPSMTITYLSDGGVRDHMFWIKANGVTIEGTGRSSKKDTVSTTYANTQFHMTLPPTVSTTQNGGYHICNENDFPNYDSDILFTSTSTFKVLNKDIVSDFIVGDTDYGRITILNADNALNNGTYIITNVSYIGSDTQFTIDTTTTEPNINTSIVPSPTPNTSTNIIYQSNLDGPNVITLKGFDCIGNERNYNEDNETVPWPAGSLNFGLNPWGAGGICIIEGNPFVSGGGNAVNQIYIENIFVWKTRDHGIALIGAILAQVINCRVSNAAGHGFYLGGTCVEDTAPFNLGGSTSSYFVNCYASSGKLGGFCSHASSYSQFQNCAAEFFGMGYFLRSSFNISLFGCGAEQNDISEDIPSNLNIQFYAVSTTGGKVLKTLNDVGVDYTGRFKGSSLFIAGGRNLYIPNFFSTEPGNRAGDLLAGSQHTTHITLYQAVRAVYITNPRMTGTSPVINPIRIERANQPNVNSDKPRDVNFFFNPVDDRPDATFFDTAPNFTFDRSNDTSACSAIIMDQGTNTEVKNGSTYYTPWVYTPDSLYTPTTPYKALLASDTNNELFPITVSENVYINVNYSVSGTGFEVYSSIYGSSNLRDDVIMPTLNAQTKRILGLSIAGLTPTPTFGNSLDIYLSTQSGATVTDTLLTSVTSSSTFPVSITLPSPISITGNNWCLKLVTGGIYTTQVGIVGLNTVNY